MAARRRQATKRGGGEAPIPLDGFDLPATVTDDRLLQIHEVLDELDGENAMHAQIVKLRFFSGMTHEEIAALMDANEKTIRRHWNVAKLWLYRRLKDDF